ncbi:hypothetical protein L9F63_014837, partial [Diploptera punctata]
LFFSRYHHICHFMNEVFIKFIIVVHSFLSVVVAQESFRDGALEESIYRSSPNLATVVVVLIKSGFPIETTISQRLHEMHIRILFVTTRLMIFETVY